MKENATSREKVIRLISFTFTMLKGDVVELIAEFVDVVDDVDNFPQELSGSLDCIDECCRKKNMVDLERWTNKREVYR